MNISHKNFLQFNLEMPFLLLQEEIISIPFY